MKLVFKIFWKNFAFPWPFCPAPMGDLYFDDSFTGCGGFGDIFGPNLNIPECQKDIQCVAVMYVLVIHKT